MIQLTVNDLLETKEDALGLKLLSGANGLGRRITRYRIQKSGLVLTGLFENVHKQRIQILGQNELSYLASIPEETQYEVLTKLVQQDIPCLIVTRGLPALPSILAVSQENDIPVLGTYTITSTFILQLTRFLENNLSSSTTIHGVLLDVIGVGVLIIGKSGVGKSECALELLLKGHRLVADDVVQIKKAYPSTLWGSCSVLTQHHMEIRGLGILNVAELFGVTAVRDRKRIDLVLELVQWDGNVEIDRLGLEHKTYPILDNELPLITIPVTHGRNMAAIVEVAARNFLLQERGIDSALAFQKRLDANMIRERMTGERPVFEPKLNKEIE